MNCYEEEEYFPLNPEGTILYSYMNHHGSNIKHIYTFCPKNKLPFVTDMWLVFPNNIDEQRILWTAYLHAKDRKLLSINNVLNSFLSEIFNKKKFVENNCTYVPLIIPYINNYHHSNKIFMIDIRFFCRYDIKLRCKYTALDDHRKTLHIGGYALNKYTTGMHRPSFIIFMPTDFVNCNAYDMICEPDEITEVKVICDNKKITYSDQKINNVIHRKTIGDKCVSYISLCEDLTLCKMDIKSFIDGEMINMEPKHIEVKFVLK